MPKSAWPVTVGATIALLALTESLPAQTKTEAPRPSEQRVMLAIVINIGGIAAIAAANAAMFGEADEIGASVTRATIGATVNAAGKALAGRGGPTSIWAGRLTGAAGSSIIKNAFRGKPALDCISVPVGPFWLNSRACDRPIVSVDALTVAGALYGFDSGKLDWGRSLAANTLVFRIDSDGSPLGLSGWAVGAAIGFLPTEEADVQRRRIGHELVHAVQHDFGTVLVSRPMTDKFFEIVTIGDLRVLKSVEWPLHWPLVTALSFTPLKVEALLEHEAQTFAH